MIILNTADYTSVLKIHSFIYLFIFIHYTLKVFTKLNFLLHYSHWIMNVHYKIHSKDKFWNWTLYLGVLVTQNLFMHDYNILWTYAILTPHSICCCLAAKSCPTLCNPMDCSCQSPLSMGFPRQEYWNGLSFPLIELYTYTLYNSCQMQVLKLNTMPWGLVTQNLSIWVIIIFCELYAILTPHDI